MCVYVGVDCDECGSLIDRLSIIKDTDIGELGYAQLADAICEHIDGVDYVFCSYGCRDALKNRIERENKHARR
jgi:hypothetical protein